MSDTFDALGWGPATAGAGVSAVGGPGLRLHGPLEDLGQLRTLNVVAEGLPGGTSLMEDYTYHMVPGNERVLGPHVLEVCPSITSDPPSLEINPRSIANRDDPAQLKFGATPGDGLVSTGVRFRLVADEVDVVEPDEPSPNVRGTCAVWKPRPNQRKLMAHGRRSPHTVLSAAGASHRRPAPS